MPSSRSRIARTRAVIVIAGAAHALIPAAAAQSSRGPLARGVLAITNASVVPMTSDTVLRDVTVLIRDGRIATLGPSRDVRVPAGTRTIDGRGKFIIPGLADMHTHLFSDDDVADSVARYELGVMLAHGVTAARLMIGTPEHLVLRRDVTAGRMAGPQLWLASPHLTGRADLNASVVTTPDEARAAVRAAADSAYDFIKITNYITRPIYDAIIDEARRRRIRVDGHVEADVGVAHALASGQHIQHLDGYFEAVLADSSPIRVSVTQAGLFQLRNWESLDHIDDAKVARIAGATARAGIWSTPTLTVFNTAFAKGQTEEEVKARPDWQILSRKHREGYMRALTRYWSPANAQYRTEARRRRYVEVRNALTKAIHDSGGKLLAGSDSPEWFMAYGRTLHRELEAFVEAGLTPYQSLLTATRNPAEFLGASAEWGTVEIGKRADLLMLSADPLADIRHTTSIDGVALGGRWFTKEELDTMIRQAADRLR
jgi:imidazolonepropionase-like amidohydrolase